VGSKSHPAAFLSLKGLLYFVRRFCSETTSGLAEESIYPLTSLANELDQQIMVDPTEAGCNVCINHGRIAVGDPFPNRLHSILTTSIRTITVGCLHEVGLKDQSQHKPYRSLHSPISDYRYPQRSEFAIGFLNVDPPDRLGFIPLLQQLLLDLSNELDFSLPLNRKDYPTIHPWSYLVSLTRGPGHPKPLPAADIII
jgi:hypothetical protein